MSGATARAAAALVLALLGGCGNAATGDAVKAQTAPVAAATGAATALPAEVEAFRRTRDLCDHWRGEDAYDEARGAEIARGVAATCTGTDAALARLRQRYRGDGAATAALAGYDDQVE